MARTPDEEREYQRRHRRNVAARGEAKLQKCVVCAAAGIDKQAFDWSHIHGTDPDDVMNYVPRCRSHHIRYDNSGHRAPHSEETKALLGRKNRGYKHTPEAVEKIRAAARNPSPEARAKMAAGGRKGVAARKEAGPMPDEQRAKLSAALKGNANAAGSHRAGAGGVQGKRTGQALENIRLGQQRRREREQAEREAGAA